MGELGSRSEHRHAPCSINRIIARDDETKRARDVSPRWHAILLTMRKNKSRTDGLEFQFFRFREQTVFAREPGKAESL